MVKLIQNVNNMKEVITAKLIVRGLPKMEDKELRDLIIWLEDKTKELRDVYSKPLPAKDYSQIYTSKLIKK